MVKLTGKEHDESFAYDSFAEPSSEIMKLIIREHLAGTTHYTYLLHSAEALKLPKNPLVC